MSELSGSFPPAGLLAADAGAAHGDQANMSAGGMLRQAREAAGLHIAALAVSLKVPVKKLEALEADQFDLLLDTVFVRALASSVCRTLKIDAEPVLERLPQTSIPKLTYHGTGNNTPFRTTGDGPRPSVWTQVSRPAVLGGILLLLGALVLILLPALKVGVEEIGFISKGPDKLSAAGPMPQAGTTAMTSSEAVRTDSNSSAVTQTTAMLSSPASATPSTVPAAFSLPVVAPSPVGATTESARLLGSPGGEAGATPVLQSPEGILVFSARAEAWVEVTDAKRQVVLRRTLSSGEVVSASGALPLVAVVGRADTTQVQVRGKVLDMSAFAKDNVARFEVK